MDICENILKRIICENSCNDLRAYISQPPLIAQWWFSTQYGYKFSSVIEENRHTFFVYNCWSNNYISVWYFYRNKNSRWNRRISVEIGYQISIIYGNISFTVLSDIGRLRYLQKIVDLWDNYSFSNPSNTFKLWKLHKSI